MKRVVVMLSVLLLTTLVLAQENEDKGKRAEIEAKKIAFISSSMNLTPEEAQIFWPVYNQLENERKEHRKQMKDSRPEGPRSDLSDAEIEKAIRNQFTMKRKEIDIQEKYFEEFKKILPANKIARLYMAEEKFKREILKEFKHQREDRDRQKARRRP